MLRFNRLIIRDFGPYKGEQIAEFPSTGVAVFYGENMRGKTSLLNAIRFALFGKVLTRGSKELSLHHLTNWEKAAKGEYGFSVSLDFTYGGSSYELTRSCKPRSEVDSPRTDLDYQCDSFLRKDGNLLGPDQRDIELARVMPEQVSRFFLFDGELLQEYEQLLHDESDMGRKIAEAIERILGVPVLTSARSALNEIVRDAQHAEAKAAQKDRQTQQIGGLLAEAQERRRHHALEVDRLTRELDAFREKKVALESFFRATERIGALLGERDQLDREVRSLKDRKSEKEQRLKEQMADAWRSVVSAKVRAARAQVARELTEIEQTLSLSANAAYLADLKKSAAATARCPVCDASLDNVVVDALRDETTDQPKPVPPVARRDELNKRLVVLAGFDFADRTEAIDEIQQSLDEITVQLAASIDRLEEIEDLIGDADQEDYRQQRSEYDDSVRAIAIVEEGIRAERKKLAEAEDSIASLQKKLSQSSSGALAAERQKRELCEGLAGLFREAVDAFRDKLRIRVEKDASELFKALTTESDYAGLRINDSYGLSIIHADGTDIPIRSAGAEHIVALSLMGALQKNAPLRGPIVMDSPFGRLDEAHTGNVVRSLPSLAQQVALLVYASELRASVARETLQGALKAEYKMARQSARYTRLERNVEVGS